jgi:hypothetical protein
MPRNIQPMPTNTESIQGIIEIFRDKPHFDMFVYGTSAGREGVPYNYAYVNPPQTTSPLTAVVEMPAREGSHAGRMLEHDFIYSIGVVVGSFAVRSQMDLDQLLDL